MERKTLNAHKRWLADCWNGVLFPLSKHKTVTTAEMSIFTVSHYASLWINSHFSSRYVTVGCESRGCVVRNKTRERRRKRELQIRPLLASILASHSRELYPTNCSMCRRLGSPTSLLSLLITVPAIVRLYWP